MAVHATNYICPHHISVYRQDVPKEDMVMKTATIGKIEEEHYDCPECGVTVTDTCIFSDIDIVVDQIYIGINTCPNCNKKVLLE